MAYSSTSYSNGYEFSQGSGYTLPEYPAVIPDAVRSGAVEQLGILIIGGGLTGLTLACSLAQLGVKAVVIDEDNTVGVKGASSRGICYTQKSLEIFDKLGIYERIKAKGIEWSVGRTFAGEDEVYNFDLKAQGSFSLSQQPAFINIQQFYNEGFLVERTMELGGVELRWNNRVSEFLQDKGVAQFVIETPGGSYKAQADFVIDATGSKTPFRDWLGVKVARKQGDDRWCIADVRFNTQPPKERHTWIEAPFNDNRAVWQHLMADDVWRIDYQMAPDADPAYVSRLTQVRERLAKQFGKDVEVEIVWVGPYAYRSECVDRMMVDLGQSLFFFIGDSAKVVSPFGARGGNTGIADADNLAWKLAAVSQGRATKELLASYQAERHEAAQTNVQVTNRTARYLRPADGAERLFRNASIALAKHYPFARALVNTGRMAVANPYTRSPLTARDLPQSHSVQNVAFDWMDGSRGQLNELLRWAGAAPLLLVWGDEQGAEHGNAQSKVRGGERAILQDASLRKLQSLSLAAGVRVVQVCASRAHVRAHEAVHDAHGLLSRACSVDGRGWIGADSPDQSGLPVRRGASRCRWALIRPDSYLAARGTAVDSRLIHALARLAGAS
jgi:3-(3-hydroxy-phenyl)propionate hydroxylase